MKLGGVRFHLWLLSSVLFSRCTTKSSKDTSPLHIYISKGQDLRHCKNISARDRTVEKCARVGLRVQCQVVFLKICHWKNIVSVVNGEEDSREIVFKNFHEKKMVFVYSVCQECEYFLQWNVSRKGKFLPQTKEAKIQENTKVT